MSVFYLSYTFYGLVINLAIILSKIVYSLLEVEFFYFRLY
jgi:hypothetical protein